MNEVRTTQPATPPVFATSSSKGAVDSRSNVDVSGKNLPLTEAGEQPEPVVSAENLGQAVAQMNDFIQNEQRDLHFSVDEVSDRVVIRVLNRETGELIRQIPEDLFLEMAKKAKEDQLVQLISVQG